MFSRGSSSPRSPRSRDSSPFTGFPSIVFNSLGLHLLDPPSPFLLLVGLDFSTLNSNSVVPSPNSRRDRSPQRFESNEDGLFSSFFKWMKHWLLSQSQHLNFFTILILASVKVPNPLFDLAGIMCGQFEVPFWKFFIAILTGKELIKAYIQGNCGWISIIWRSSLSDGPHGLCPESLDKLSGVDVTISCLPMDDRGTKARVIHCYREKAYVLLAFVKMFCN